uniref:Cell adhesion molecule 2-like n=1 Tax=Saccoglossus kowalevskii TaxID=10224 RepID=A0ABM0MNU7_SACKO
MAGQQIRWKLLCSLAALISSVTTQPSTPSFVDQPISETLEEGDTLILRCSFGNFTSDFNAQWVRDDVVFSKDFEVYREQRLVNFFGVTEPSRYSVIGNASLGEFYLQIRHTTVSDAGEYACRLSDTIGQLSDSDTAVIQINSLPETSYPRCFPTDLDSFYTEGETLRVECVYRGATEPLPSLTWVRRNQPLNGERLYDSLSDVAYNWTFVSDDHGRSILCVYNYGEVETQRCEIGPVTVYYKSTIQMDPFIYVTVGQSVQITAEVDSYPAPYSYIWEINNLNVENEQRIFVNGNILTILDAYETD